MRVECVGCAVIASFLREDRDTILSGDASEESGIERLSSIVWREAFSKKLRSWVTEIRSSGISQR